MSQQTKTIIIGLIFFLFCCVASYFAGHVKGRKIGWETGYSDGFEAGYNTPHPADTIATIDTLYIDRPTEVVKWKERVVLMPVRDTIRVADSVFVEVPIEAKIYADSNYRAQVSGWRPSLDWIEVYQRTTTITNYIEKVRPPKWEVAAFAEAALPFKARAGLEMQERILNPLNVYLRTGYEWQGVGWYVEGGVRVIIKSEQ